MKKNNQQHNSEPCVAYIVVLWNNIKLIDQCLESINKQTCENKLTIVVDNASSDGTADYIKKKYSNEVVLLELPTNTGFTGGNNIGIEEALKHENVKYVALVNSDAVLDVDWTSNIVSFMERKPKAAMAQGTTLDFYDHNIVDSFYTYIARNSQATQAGWRDVYEGDLPVTRVFGVNAAACVISRRFIAEQPFSKSGLFDKKFFMYLEDVDIAARATVLGWDNYVVPNAHAYHMGSASSSKNPTFSLYYTFRNNSAVLFKNFSFSMLIRLAIPLIRSDFHTFRHLRRQGKKDVSWIIYKARIAGLFRIPLYIKDRRIISRARKIDDNYIWQLMRKVH